MKLRLALSTTLLLALASVRADEKQGLVIPFKTVSVSSPVLQEVIDSVLVEEGTEVTEGQPIVQLRAEREALEVERTQKLIDLGTFKTTGAQSLFNDKMGSKEKWLEEKAQLELSTILHRAAETMLKEKTVRSPLAGVVVKKYKEAGESVDRAEKLMDIVNIDQVYVQFYLNPELMEKTKEGQEVRVKFPVINHAEFTGKITFVDPRIDAGSGFFRVKVLLENKARTIKAGMRATANFGSVK